MDLIQYNTIKNQKKTGFSAMSEGRAFLRSQAGSNPMVLIHHNTTKKPGKNRTFFSGE